MRFVDNKDYPEPGNDAYYDLPANSGKSKKRYSREFDDIHEGRERMIRCPVKPVKWWNRAANQERSGIPGGEEK